MVKKLSCGSCGSLKRFPHKFTTEKGLATHNEEFSLQSLKLLEYLGIKTKMVLMYIQQKDVSLQPIPSIIDSKAQYFYSFKASYKARTRLLKSFVLIILCCKTKHLRSLVRGIISGFE